MRGLTTIPDPLGSGKQTFLGGLEGEGGSIVRIDPIAGTVTSELDINPLLIASWGSLANTYTISAYNDMPLTADPDSGRYIRLIGLQAHNPNADKVRSAWFLVRQASDQSYSLKEVPPLSGLSVRGLVAVRTIIVSPFPEDRGNVIYLGGFDADFIDSHNSAWLYRVGIRTAMR
jgi:hypothetical protein